MSQSIQAEAGQYLFVYGTLAPGEVNAHVLEPLKGSWQPATIRGTLHPEGWGASYGFPAMRLDENAEHVQGLLFTAPGLEDHWPMLDEFEGDAYKRVAAMATLADGLTVTTQIYVLNEG